jgi:SAM-dependent methyltransferase
MSYHVLPKLREFLVKIALRLGFYTYRYKDYTTYIQRLIGVVAKRGKILCLDLGCGNGFFTHMLSGLCNDAVGIDLVKYSKWRTRLKSNFIVSDARRIPLRSQSIDAVLILSLLEHVPNWRIIILEVSRVLRNSGIVLIQLPNLNFIIEPHTHLPFIAFMPKRIKDALTFNVVHDILQWDCNLREVISVLKNYSFKVLGIIFYNYAKSLHIFGVQTYLIVAMKNREGNA